MQRLRVNARLQPNGWIMYHYNEYFIGYSKGIKGEPLMKTSDLLYFIKAFNLQAPCKPLCRGFVGKIH